MKSPIPVFAVAAIAATSAYANDTMANLGTGGLVFIQTDAVTMASEDLYVSPEEIRVRYEFRNETDKDISTLVAFPMPDITGSPDFMVGIPTEDNENIFGFESTFAGAPVEATLHQYAFGPNNIEYTDLLIELGVPLAPHIRASEEAIDALSEDEQMRLFSLGLAIPLEFDSGQGWEKHFFPGWTLKSTYSWEAIFPAGETVTVEHRYKPSVGGTVAVTFLSEPYEGYDPFKEYTDRYCIDDAFVNAVKKTMSNPDETWTAPFTESWMRYIWSTGANWNGPVGRFHLTIDKGDADNLVSFCWDGKVTKTSPTTFEMDAENWWPPYNRELDVLLLVKREDTAG